MVPPGNVKFVSPLLNEPAQFTEGESGLPAILMAPDEVVNVGVQTKLQVIMYPSPVLMYVPDWVAYATDKSPTVGKVKVGVQVPTI